MKNLIVFNLLAFFSLTTFGQFTDNFSDGNFTSSPQWIGNTSKFQVDGFNVLNLAAPPTTDIAYLTTNNTAIANGEWIFDIQLDFAPSPFNYAKVYLVSNQQDLSGNLNGYFVKIGGVNGTADDVSLYRQSGTTETLIIDGTDGVASTSPNLRIKVTRDALGNWELFSDLNITGTFTSEGTAFDDIYIGSNTFGIFCKYTSSNSTNFHFDNFSVVGTTITDNFPPLLDSIQVMSNDSLRLFFNEPVDKASSENPTKYLLYSTIGGITPVYSPTRDPLDSSIVNLKIGAPLFDGFLDTLFVSDVVDTANNISPVNKGTFRYYLEKTAVEGDVIVNEIMAHPVGSPALPNEEYIELYNRSNKAYNLKGWTVKDNNGPSGNFEDYYLLPDSIMILIHNNKTGAFAPFTDKVLEVNNMVALNKDFETVIIANEFGNTIDEVSYTDQWYRNSTKAAGGWSLERINPLTPCSDINNWSASIHVDGGTPGDTNSITALAKDTVASVVEHWEVNSTTSLTVYFNEIMDSASLKNGLYSLDGGINIINVTVPNKNPNYVSLKTSPDLDKTSTYHLSISNISDCGGNPSNDTTFRVAVGVRPEPYEIVFNEIFPDPDVDITSLPNAEYIEILNRTTKALQLKNLTFTDGSETAELPNRIIFPGEVMLLVEVENINSFANYKENDNIIGIEKWTSLNSTGENLTLYNDNIVIDNINYTKDWYQDEEKAKGGWALELINPNDPCSKFGNWAASTSNIGGTPADTNSLYQNGSFNTSTFETVSIVSDSSILLNFDRAIDVTRIPEAILFIAPFLEIKSIEPLAIDQKAIEITFVEKIERGSVYNVTLDSLYDCLGTKITRTERQFILADWNDIVINEVLFNPYPGGSDFVEIYNNADSEIDLFNWSFRTINAANDTTYKPLTDKHILLPKNGFATFTEDTNSIVLNYPDAVVENIYYTDLPSYSNTEGTVTLTSTDQSVIDNFSYNESMHFGLLDDLEGVSLERIDYLRPTNDATNWHSASEQENYATPGYENSQYSSAGTTTSEFEIVPETFSPNNDGHEDVVNIVYNLEKEGYSATIKIYDPNGRVIRELENNYLLGKQGTISWDGINDDNQKAHIGIYIIFIEIFDLEGNTKQYKKTCVLATEL